MAQKFMLLHSMKNKTSQTTKL